MKLRKKDVIFLILSALIVVMAIVFTFVGARASGPEIVLKYRSLMKSTVKSKTKQ